MYDMHCHVLPGVDDGANNLEEAISMAIMAKENGIQAMFATPHFIEGAGSKDAIFNKQVLDMLDCELQNRNIDIKVYLGCEVYSTSEILKLLERKQITTLNNSNYILIELPMHHIPLDIESIIYKLKLKGITPIIAHPERNNKIVEDPNILYKLISKGVLAQLNLPSLLGKYGSNIKKTAEILLKHDMIHFVGTDAHRPSDRYYNISEALDIIINLVGKERLLKITEINPEYIITGVDIKIDPPRLYKRKKGIKKLLHKLLDK